MSQNRLLLKCQDGRSHWLSIILLYCIKDTQGKPKIKIICVITLLLVTRAGDWTVLRDLLGLCPRSVGDVNVASSPALRPETLCPPRAGDHGDTAAVALAQLQ